MKYLQKLAVDKQTYSLSFTGVLFLGPRLSHNWHTTIISTLQPTFCLREIGIKVEKMHREKTIKENISRTCGLWNSGGGRLVLSYGKVLPSNHILDCAREIKYTGRDRRSKVDVRSAKKVFAKRGDRMVGSSVGLFTSNYLSFSTKRVVIPLLPNNPVEEVQDIIHGRNSLQSESLSFVMKQLVGLRKILQEKVGTSRLPFSIKDQIPELPVSCAVQLMNSKASLSKCVKLSDRITGTTNRFLYVSAFANCYSGHICYGTRNNGKSYIVQGKVQETSFPDWWANFSSSTRCTRIHSVPLHLPCITWSSEKNRKIYRFLTSKLVQYRNDQIVEKFARISRSVIDKFPDSVAPPVVMSEEVTVVSKNCHFRNAHSLLRAFMGSSNGNELDRLIFDVIELSLKSRLKRAEGNNRESHKIATVGLQKMRLIPAEFITVRFYVHAATVATILASIDDLRYEVKQCLDYASRDAKMVRTSDSRIDSDLEQKLRICRAEAYMGCSLTGAAPTDSRTVTSEDLDNAAAELTAVHQSNLKGHIPTHFRKSQLLLVQSDLYYLRSKCPQNGESCSEYLNTAYQYAKEALALATELNFEELIPYANKRLKVLRETFNSSPDVDDDTDLKILEDLEISDFVESKEGWSY